jgi:hypothetical protein
MKCGIFCYITLRTDDDGYVIPLSAQLHAGHKADLIKYPILIIFNIKF